MWVECQYTERWSELHCITEFLSQPTNKVFLTHPEFKPVTPPKLKTLTLTQNLSFMSTPLFLQLNLYDCIKYEFNIEKLYFCQVSKHPFQFHAVPCSARRGGLIHNSADIPLPSFRFLLRHQIFTYARQYINTDKISLGQKAKIHVFLSSGDFL